MNITNRQRLSVGLALVGVVLLAGCSYPGQLDPSSTTPAPSPTTTVSSEDEPDSDEEEGDAAADDPSDLPPAPEETDQAADEADSEEDLLPTLVESVQIDLSPESGTQYLHAIQAFSPLLESWVVDAEAGEVTYTRYTCIGTIDGISTGALVELDGDDRYQVVWDGPSPMRYSSGPSERFTMTDRTLIHGSATASSRTDVALQGYVSMCAEAGEAVAGFIL